MIVISGALVLVALVLLIVGVVGPDLAFVYASIGVSLVSLAFLVIGILQRRGEPLPADEGVDGPQPATVEEPADQERADDLPVGPSSVPLAAAPAPVEAEDDVVPVPADEPPVTDTVDVAPVPLDEPPVADTVDEEPVPGGEVLVVQGRPRYHVVGCRYLSGKTPEATKVARARNEGFTPCGVCKPDVVLAAVAEQETAPEQVAAEPAARRTAATRTPPTRTPPTRTPPTRTPATRTPATRARVTRTTAAPLVVPVVPPTSPAPARAAASRGGSVVVVPDRGRYHRTQCRHVRDVGGAQVLSRAAATRQGYLPCGACKP